MAKTLAMPPTSRRYVKPAVLLVLAVEIERIAHDKARTGQPMPPDADLARWLGFGTHAVTAVRKYLERSK